MNFASVLMLLVGVFGLIMLVFGLLSLGQSGDVPLPWVGLKFGGWFLIIVSLFLAAGGLIGFSRMRRR
jgi:membrane-bound ClpP family serine protease